MTEKLLYAVRLQHDEKTQCYVVTCRDLPLLNSVGDSVEDALLEAIDAALLALDIERAAGRRISAPSRRQEGEYVIQLPVEVTQIVHRHNMRLSDRAGQ